MAEAPAAEASGFSSAIVSIPLPRIFGRLLLLKLLARGGMGDVYLAATTGIEGAERPIVVKTVRRDHIHDGSFLARFLDEARVQSQLNHPGVVPILEASTDENGEPFTVVDYVEGRSLADVRHRAVQVGAKIGWPEAVAIAIEMGQALSHVHERAGADGTPLGIVHRDLSPQNVMVGYAGEVKLIDFGTARGHNRRCHTVAGVVFAKPGYVAPEVARQQVGDGRIDIYAMGVMLWELCAGKRLLTGDPQEHLEEVAANKFELPKLAAARGIPPELDTIMQTLCGNDPDDRYASAGQAATDLARVLAQAPAGKSGERSVRARIAILMKTLWPHEPARSRAEFAKLLRQARELRASTPETPPASGVMEIQASSMAQDPKVLAGTPYRLLEKIGEGASGEVFEAEHVELGRKYAVKVLSAAHAAAHDAVERFRREARAIAKLSHPNLVQLHDFGKSLDGRVFLAMELLDGQTLDLHAEKGIGWREAARLGIQAARSLEAAHGAGLVHRDLKPQNLFLTRDGELKLLDFGVAMALAETDADKRQKGFAVFGTPEYMAPEQVAGESVDARCDVYALGCVLYELVTGTRPFEGSPVVVMGKQMREEPERPSLRAPNAVIPRELEAVILRALAKSKEERFGSALEMRAALEEAIQAPDRRRSRGRALTTLVVIASLAVLVTGVLRDRVRTPAAISRLMTREPVTVPVSALPEAPAAPPSETAAAAATATSTEDPSKITEGAPAATAPVAAPVPGVDTSPKKTAALPERTEDPSKKSGLLVRTSARSTDRPQDIRARLTEARAAARANANDPAALKAWTAAALQAKEHREARRAAESWAVHDASVEPRLYLAAALEASGRKREARSVLEEWIASHPDGAEARRALARIGSPPEPAIKRTGRGRSTRSQLHPPDPVVEE